MALIVCALFVLWLELPVISYEMGSKMNVSSNNSSANYNEDADILNANHDIMDGLLPAVSAVFLIVIFAFTAKFVIGALQR